jgi:hypothetical protein
MAGAFNPASRTTLVVGRARQPGRFVALTNDLRIDAVLAQGRLSLTDALERRAPIDVNSVLQGPNDGSGPLIPAPNIKSVDPRAVIIGMPAEGGDPVVSAAEREAWQTWRVTYEVTLEATPFKVAGILLLLPSQDPFLLTERGQELFLPVFSPTVEVGEVMLTDVRHDGILVNRSHLHRVLTVMRH